MPGSGIVRREARSVGPLDLSTRVAAGDTEAFRRLFDEHFDRLYRFVYRYIQSAEAEDLVQEVFLRLWRVRGTLETATDLRGFLYVLARQRALDWLRHRNIEDRHRLSLVRSEDRGPDTGDPEAQLESRELAA